MVEDETTVHPLTVKYCIIPTFRLALNQDCVHRPEEQISQGNPSPVTFVCAYVGCLLLHTSDFFSIDIL